MIKMICMALILTLAACAAEPNKARDPSGEGLGPTQGVNGATTLAP